MGRERNQMRFGGYKLNVGIAKTQIFKNMRLIFIQKI